VKQHKNRITETQLRQYLNEKIKRILKEAEAREDMDRYGLAAFSALESDVETAADEAEDKMSEAIDTIIGLILSGPFILKMFGRFIKFISKAIEKKFGVGQAGTEAGEWLIHFAEKYHHVVMKPFEHVASKFTDDPAKQQKIALHLFNLVIAALLVYTGYSFMKKIQSAHYDWGAVWKVMKVHIKGAELWSNVKTLLAGAADEITVIVGEYTDDAAGAAV
jgi:hypothetical protein